MVINQQINTPDLYCIYNSVNEQLFDLRLCTEPDLKGNCTALDQIHPLIITGDFNWYARGTKSIMRTA